MTFHQPDLLRYFTFDSLSEAGVKHAVFTRHGGISPDPWKALNVGGTVGDDAGRVAENRRRMFTSFGRSPESAYDVWQVHSADVICTGSPRPVQDAYVKADAILTSQPGITLFMRFADCVPIFLFDPLHRVVGLVHAGWMGTIRHIAREAVGVMQERYGSNPADLIAAIGPSIGPDHYTVGQDVIAQVKDAFGADASGILPSTNGSVQFDLWKANRLVLEGCGVRHIETAGICTACHPEDWYSHRGEHGKTGRFGALIGL